MHRDASVVPRRSLTYHCTPPRALIFNMPSNVGEGSLTVFTLDISMHEFKLFETRVSAYYKKHLNFI